jgi:PAS domain S-box-containing protein
MSTVGKLLQAARAEVEMREEHFHTLANSIPQLAWMADASGYIFWYNRRWYDYTGTTLEEMEGWGWQKVHHPEEVGRVVEPIRHAFATGEPWEDTFPLRSKEGEYRWFLSRALPIQDDEGRVVRWFGTNTDITEQRKLEQELRHAREELERKVDERTAELSHANVVLREQVAERRRAEQSLLKQTEILESILHHMGDAVVVADRDEKFLVFNPAAERMFGASATETTADQWPEQYGLYLPDGVTPFPHDELPLSRAIRGEEVDDVEIFVRHVGAPGGLWTRITGRPLRDAAGELSGGVIVCRDITERKQAEEEVRREKEFSETMMDSMPGVFYHYDATGKFLRWNQNFEAVTGYSRDEIARMHPLDFFAGDDKRLVGERIGRVFDTGEGSVEADFVCKDGRAVPYYFTGRRVLFGGEPYLIGVGIDITERKRAEEALRQTQGDLARMSRVTALGELAASIAHEVNQPLASIIGNADICLIWLSKDSPDLAQLRDAISDIHSDGHRAGEVLRRIRDLVRKGDAQKTLLDINEVVGEVTSLLSGAARGRRVRVQSKLCANLPRVPGDRVQLQQVLLNLLMNALDAMSAVEEARRELVVETSEDGEGGGVLVVVSDRGPGLSPQDTERVFGAFYTTKPEGMGMGLSISRSIIRAHGGRLWATANDGGGACFRFTLPSSDEVTP